MYTLTPRAQAFGLPPKSRVPAPSLLAKCSIELRVRGGISQEVLCAEFVGNLVECQRSRLRVFRLDHPATGFLREFPQYRVAAESHPQSAIETPIADIDRVNDGVGFLRRLDCRVQLNFASLIFTVRQQDEDLSAHFVFEQLARR